MELQVSFFILEARLKTGHDSDLPAEGLAIYHCDTTMPDNDNESLTRTAHYLCSLIQCDGLFELEAHSHERGDAEDLLRAGGEISDTTSPDCKLWNGTNSGLRVIVKSIDRAAGIIKVSLGSATPPPQITRKTWESKPNETIPDNFREGINNSVQITDSGRCISAKVSVDIAHLYSGDLSIILTNPSARQAIIKRPNAQVSSPFAAIVDLDVTSSFGTAQITGFWTLTVSDFYPADLGTLNSWSLTLEFGP